MINAWGERSAQTGTVQVTPTTAVPIAPSGCCIEYTYRAGGLQNCSSPAVHCPSQVSKADAPQAAPKALHILLTESSASSLKSPRGDSCKEHTSARPTLHNVSQVSSQSVQRNSRRPPGWMSSATSSCSDARSILDPVSEENVYSLSRTVRLFRFPDSPKR